MKACVLIRDFPVYRRDSFVKGLKAVGYSIDDAMRPAPENLLVIWNRYGSYDAYARQYERAGGTVLVVENGYLGREWRDQYWYAISKSYHNGGGWWHDGGPKRWDSLDIHIKDWRNSGEDILVLATRHIGPQGVKEPEGWAVNMAEKLRRITSRNVIVRNHPGENKPETSLYDDLNKAFTCVTWGSGAALKALLYGVPVLYGYPHWIGKDCCRYIGSEPHQFTVTYPSMHSRLPTFQKLAWAMWNTEEIAAGEPFKCLLQ